ncbi:MAG: hypothetical protein LBE16_05550 [Clostridiales Family XIII bacterium]|jgi:hypothetical protein|nr:hypothetical protein [Clostridiales Family XIII bacterium]
MYIFIMRRRLAVATAALLVIFGLLSAFAPAKAFAAESKVSVGFEANVINTKQGAKDVSFTLTLKNQSGGPIEGISANIGKTNGFTNERALGGQTSLAIGEEARYTFVVDVDANAAYGTSYIPITFTYSGGELWANTVSVNVARNLTPASVGVDTPVVDMSYKLDGDSLKASETTNLGVTLTNRGNVMLQDVQVTLVLPDIMSLDNSSVIQFVGYMGVGESKNVRFPILTDKKAENKNYSVSVKISAVNKGATVSFDRPIYIPVTGGQQQGAIADVLIQNINLPHEAVTGEEFTLSFEIANNSKGPVDDLKIEISPEAGVINKTKSVFVEPKVPQGETRSYTVTLFSNKEKTEQKSYPIKITATMPKDSASVTQYASIFLRKAETGNVKTPRLIVENYSYGGAFVQAGKEFNLSIGLYNTSSKTLSNIKATFTSENGAILPAGGSNSFYVDRVSPSAGVFKSLRMAASSTAEQRAATLKLDMIYEDSEGNEFASSDIVSIPIVQETALAASDVVAPSDLRVGVQSTMNVQFYNVGKTQLRNLRIVASGDFTTREPINYYVGNLDSGGSDSYDFAFTPKNVENMAGKIVFSYYDPAGNERYLEKEFSFPVEQQAPADNVNAALPTDPSMLRNKLYIGGGVALLAIVIITTVLRHLKNKKLHGEMEIDE